MGVNSFVWYLAFCAQSTENGTASLAYLLSQRGIAPSPWI
jgi:hypothetical protein